MRPRIISINTPAVSTQLDGRGGVITYWAFRETTGNATATCRLWDGSGNGGALIAPITLAANESIREFPGHHALPYHSGLFLEVLSGSIEGQVTVIALEEWPHEGALPVFVVGSVDLTLNDYGVS